MPNVNQIPNAMMWYNIKGKRRNKKTRAVNHKKLLGVIFSLSKRRHRELRQTVIQFNMH